MADWWQNQEPGKPGDPNCKQCGGEGVLLVPDSFPPRYKNCVCMHYKDILRNVERGLPGLTKAQRLKPGTEGAFKGKLDQNLWITAPQHWFRAQLRWIMIRQPPRFWFKVTSDAELMRAWLGTVHLKGLNIIDPDAHQVSSRYMNLEDLVEPPGLLIIHVGVKKARNEASPEVLFETLNIRSFRGKPTWIFNEDHTPFDGSMPSHSYEVEAYLNEWEHITRKSPKKTIRNPTGQMPDVSKLLRTETEVPAEEGSSSEEEVVTPVSTSRPRRGLASNSGNQTQALELPEITDKPKKGKSRTSSWNRRKK